MLAGKGMAGAESGVWVSVDRCKKSFFFGVLILSEVQAGFMIKRGE